VEIVMKRWTVSLLLIAVVSTTTGNALAQFQEGTFSVRPEFGFGLNSNFGVVVGALVNYGIADNMAIGPVFEFSTAGRALEGTVSGIPFKTSASNSLIIGGRYYYLFAPESEYPWYLDFGLAVVSYGKNDEADGGGQLAPGGDPLVFDGSSRLAFNFGGGSMFNMGDNRELIIDVNSYIGSHGEPSATWRQQEGTFQDAGTFWQLNFTVGVEFFL
jgi:hypothetical protein